MATIRTPKEFNRVLSEKILDLIWAQWRTFGIAAYGSESARLLDLEALILGTAAMGMLDRRLGASSRQWLISSREWISLSRLKRMSREFISADVLVKKPLIGNEDWRDLLALLDPLRSADFPKNRTVRERDDSVVLPPRLKKSSLRQLYLRGIFGVNARAEIYLYLSLEGQGNSNRIAREVHYDQKSVYRILERWTEAGLTVRESGLKENLYSLAPGYVFGPIEHVPESFWRWHKFFLFFSSLSAAASNAPWDEDAYLSSSLFRDLHPGASAIASAAGIALPDPNLYSGQEYFSPMAEALISILNRFIG